MYRNLDQFIAALEQAGELLRIRVPVDPVLEIAELTDRQAKQPGGGKALLFEQTGTQFPVVTNLFGSRRRMCMALGVNDMDDIARRIEGLAGDALRPRAGWVDKLKLLPLLREAAGWMPRQSARRGACQDVVWQGEAIDLARMPILQCWPHDGGRFVTLPMVHTLDPDTGVRNVGMYRLQVMGPSTTGMHWHRHKTGERHYRAYKARGERMPVTVCIGGDPVYTYCATAPLPDGVDEYLLAGFLRRRPVRLVKCLTNSLWVPEDCDWVIEGYVDPAEEKVLEGDFGDHTGFYSLKDYYPRFHITCITHRRGALYPATVVGVPPQEDAWLGWATERIFLAPLRAVVTPELTDLWMPPPGVAHNLAIGVIRKSYAGQAIKVAHALWGAGQMGFNKALVLLSAEDVPPPASGGDHPASLLEVVRERLHCLDPARDVLFSRGVLDVLDHAAPELGFGGKICVDLTRKLPEEGGERPVQPNIPIQVQWDAEVEALIRTNALEFNDLLWLAAANADPGRDISIDPNGLLRVDARSKPELLRRGWPNIVTMSPEVIELVDRRWAEYGLGPLFSFAPFVPFVPSPSLRYLPLVHSLGAAR